MTLHSETCRTAAALALAAAAARERAAGSTGPWLLAFSGGPDSLALALALARIDGPSLVLAHVDHGLDPGSGERAHRAGELAQELELSCTLLERGVLVERRPGENLEAAARRVRYAALEEARRAVGADRILTAHHLDDQIETILMRLVSGATLLGLGGIRERRGAVWRPALGLSRAGLAEVVAASGLAPIRDPTNADLARQRNRIRHQLLPHLRRTEPAVTEALARLALRASCAREAMAKRLDSLYDLRPTDCGAELALAAIEQNPSSLNLFALQLLEELAGVVLPSSTRSRLELLRRIAAEPRPGLPASIGRRWAIAGSRLELRREGPDEGRTPAFSYTLPVPGEVTVPELGGRMCLRPAAAEGWMRRGETHRAAFRFPGPIPATCEVRNRRPGDRLKPLGAPGMRSLKELFIDRKVPWSERDRIPLLVAGGRIAWVPGITIDDGHRLRDEDDCWVAEWLPRDVPKSEGRT